MKKRLEKALPIKSNLTLDEQIYFIEKTFEFLEDVEDKNLIFNNVKYTGMMNKQYGFFKETKRFSKKKELFSLKLNPKGIIDSKNILKIIDFIDEQKFNRLFTITIKEKESIITDNLMNISETFFNIIYKPQNEFSFSINSFFLYLFRLNKKTLSKDTYLLIFEKYMLVLLIRKRIKMIIYISI
jgi:hypothetical protein